MKKLLLSTTFLVVSSAAATAAPVFNWTGCYVGAHVGGTTINTLTATNFEGPDTSITENGTGAVAGGQMGCNFQQGSWVFGVEGEGSWSNGTTTNVLTFPISAGSGSESFTTKNTGDFSIAGRAGFAFDRTLIYGKGGWAWSSFDFNSTLSCCPTLSDSTSTSVRTTLNGFLVGAGVEHALTRNWTVKLEYNYLDLGSRLLNLHVTPGDEIFSLRSSVTKQTLKLGVNYLFGSGPALVATK